jgi:hypothetical protein
MSHSGYLREGKFFQVLFVAFLSFSFNLPLFGSAQEKIGSFEYKVTPSPYGFDYPYVETESVEGSSPTARLAWNCFYEGSNSEPAGAIITIDTTDPVLNALNEGARVEVGYSFDDKPSRMTEFEVYTNAVLGSKTGRNNLFGVKVLSATRVDIEVIVKDNQRYNYLFDLTGLQEALATLPCASFALENGKRQPVVDASQPTDQSQTANSEPQPPEEGEAGADANPSANSAQAENPIIEEQIGDFTYGEFNQDGIDNALIITSGMGETSSESRLYWTCVLEDSQAPSPAIAVFSPQASNNGESQDDMEGLLVTFTFDSQTSIMVEAFFSPPYGNLSVLWEQSRAESALLVEGFRTSSQLIVEFTDSLKTEHSYLFGLTGFEEAAKKLPCASAILQTDESLAQTTPEPITNSDTIVGAWKPEAQGAFESDNLPAPSFEFFEDGTAIDTTGQRFTWSFDAEDNLYPTNDNPNVITFTLESNGIMTSPQGFRWSYVRMSEEERRIAGPKLTVELVEAAMAGDVDTLRRLYEAGAAKENPYGEVLGTASAYGQLAAVQYLTEIGVGDPVNAFRVAFEQEHIEVLRYLIEAHSVSLFQQVREKVSDELLVQDALTHLNFDLLRFLFELGVSTSHVTSNSYFMNGYFDRLFYHNELDSMRTLFQIIPFCEFQQPILVRTRLNLDEVTLPLIISVARSKNYEFMKLLLENGSDPYKKYSVPDYEYKPASDGSGNVPVLITRQASALDFARNLDDKQQMFNLIIETSQNNEIIPCPGTEITQLTIADLCTPKPVWNVEDSFGEKSIEYARWTACARQQGISPSVGDGLSGFYDVASDVTNSFDFWEELDPNMSFGTEKFLERLSDFLYSENSKIFLNIINQQELISPLTNEKQNNPLQWAIDHVRFEQGAAERFILEYGLSQEDIDDINDSLRNAVWASKATNSIFQYRYRWAYEQVGNLKYEEQSHREAIGIAYVFDHFGLMKEQYIKYMADNVLPEIP